MKRLKRVREFCGEVKSDLAHLDGGEATIRRFSALLFFSPGFKAIFLYRIQKFFGKLGLIRLQLLISSINQHWTGAEICVGATIGSPCVIRHPSGIVVGGGAIIGNRVTLLQGSTIGQSNVMKDFDNSGPFVGDDVVIGANSSVLGSIVVADGTKLGAHSLLLESTIANCTYVGNPARILKHNE